MPNVILKNNMNMENWVTELLGSLDASVDEITKQKILEKCGSRCPFTHLSDEKLITLRNQATTEQEFLEKLSEAWRLKKENNQYYVIFDQCYCPLVNKDTKNASQTMCYCTLGNLKHKFRLGLGREVDVDMEKTVLSGDDECRFKIKITM